LGNKERDECTSNDSPRTGCRIPYLEEEEEEEAEDDEEEEEAKE
jgi:hypothetical protein